MFFGRLINRKLQRRGETLIQESSRLMARAAKLLSEIVAAMASEDAAQLSALTKKIITIERQADTIKDELIEEVLTKRAYLKQSAQDRYELIIRIDKILSRIEHSARLMEALHVELTERKKQLFNELSFQVSDTVIKLQEAIENLWVDYKKAQEITREVEEKRESARKVFYNLLKAIKMDEISNKSSFLVLMAESLIQVAVSAEVGADHVRAIIIRSY